MMNKNNVTLIKDRVQKLHSIDLLCKVRDEKYNETYYFKPSDMKYVKEVIYPEDGTTGIYMDVNSSQAITIEGMSAAVLFATVDSEIERINKLVAEFQAKQMEKQKNFMQSNEPPLTLA